MRDLSGNTLVVPLVDHVADCTGLTGRGPRPSRAATLAPDRSAAAAAVGRLRGRRRVSSRGGRVSWAGLEHGIVAVVDSDATGALCYGSRALDTAPVDVGVVSVVEPVVAPVAALLEDGGKVGALRTARGAAVAVAGEGEAELRRAAVEDAKAWEC